MHTNEIDSRLKLILSAQVDTLDELEKIWMFGYVHGKKNKSETLNPFPVNTIEHNYWAEGFEAGEFNEPPLFPQYISILSEIAESDDALEVQTRKKYHLDKVDRLLATAGVSVATASMVAAALINFMA
ncbi:hypothetical protein [Fastidiosibacter lacustris]|uniref:hypothetical protein n=1 Tax=Fastidiosibacter lacustris TaxID=2056695 RepID=UPI00130067C7|nr:hypothetical protein [Fastidiosibacter lacustris]